MPAQIIHDDKSNIASCLEKIKNDNIDGIFILDDNLNILPLIPNEFVDLIYIDPPFNTGKTQKKSTIRCEVLDTENKNGEGHKHYRTGFGGKFYEYYIEDEKAYSDSFGEGYLDFLYERIVHAHRILKNTGVFYFHIDYREAHYCKVFVLDKIFGRANFLNEIIWAYDYGGRSKKKWPAKHDNIFMYCKNNNKYYFDIEQSDRLPYLAPGLVSEEKRLLGKLPTDVWWHTIVPTNSKEKANYPTQKPLGVINRIIKTSSPENGLVLDFFAGSGTTGVSSLMNNRRFILIDNNYDAMITFKQRLDKIKSTLTDKKIIMIS
ncbi:MAG: site-specific DNA-methyltransferase [Candidatus Bilamarchaeaceae archaeon]